MDRRFYKTENDETGYSKYISETKSCTTIISFGGIPKLHIIYSSYPRNTGEVLQESSEEEFEKMNRTYLLEKKKTYRVEAAAVASN